MADVKRGNLLLSEPQNFKIPDQRRRFMPTDEARPIEIGNLIKLSFKGEVKAVIGFEQAQVNSSVEVSRNKRQSFFERLMWRSGGVAQLLMNRRDIPPRIHRCLSVCFNQGFSVR